MPTPRFAVSTATTWPLSFAEDLRVYREAGADGIGIHSLKLDNDKKDLELFEASGLEASICLPSPESILPFRGTALPGGPQDVPSRVDAVIAGMRRLAPFRPAAVACVAGPLGDYERDEAWELLVQGFQRIAQAAADEGITLALEPMHSSIRDEWSFVTTLPEAVEILEEAGAPNTGIFFDIWHLWDTPDVLAHIREHASRFVGVHLNDVREPTRSWCDRLMPGDGVADSEGIFRALADADFDGWWELEILSDDGSFHNDFPDSLWKLDPLEFVRSAREKFLRLWEVAYAPTA